MKKKPTSIYLGKVAGTAIYLHWTFLALIFFIFYSTFREEGSWNQALIAVLFLVSVFACITLHELGHITVARRYDCRATEITLYPIGGIASLEKIPDKPWQEFWMALAGPWVNVIIAAVLFLAISLTSGMPGFHGLHDVSADTFWYNLMVVNISLALFNLIPAFPTDGGRVLRSLLSLWMNRVKATRIAARVGQIIAVGFIILGVFYNWWLIIIGLVIITGAGSEALLEMTRAAMAQHRVRDIVMTKFTLLSASDTLGKVMQLILDSQEKAFVINSGDGTFGTVTSKEIIRGLQDNGKDVMVSAVMNRYPLLLHPDTTLEEAFRRMAVSGARISPVIEHGELKGMLDMENISEFITFRMALEKDGARNGLFLKRAFE